MDYKCAVIICVLLSVIVVQGQLGRNGERCLCEHFSKKIDVKRIRKLDIYSPSSKCKNEEYIVTIKQRKNTKETGPKIVKKCVSPGLKQVKDILGGKYPKIKVIRHPLPKQ